MLQRADGILTYFGVVADSTLSESSIASATHTHTHTDNKMSTLIRE